MIGIVFGLVIIAPLFLIAILLTPFEEDELDLALDTMMMEEDEIESRLKQMQKQLEEQQERIDSLESNIVMDLDRLEKELEDRK